MLRQIRSNEKARARARDIRESRGERLHARTQIKGCRVVYVVDLVKILSSQARSFSFPCAQETSLCSQVEWRGKPRACIIFVYSKFFVIHRKSLLSDIIGESINMWRRNAPSDILKKCLSSILSNVWCILTWEDWYHGISTRACFLTGDVNYLCGIPNMIFRYPNINSIFTQYLFAIWRFYNMMQLIHFLHLLQDVFILETPGGGGYGEPREKQDFTKKTTKTFVERGSIFEYRKAQESV